MRSHLLAAVLMFAIWPFHHKHKPVPQPDTAPWALPFAMQAPIVTDADCEKEGDYFFFIGPDGTGIGVSDKSCTAAFMDWNKIKYLNPYYRA